MGPRPDGGTRGVTTSLDSERLALLVHEVRSPVAALSAIAETLGEGRFDSEARRSLVRLVTLACRGIERIVADAAVASIRLESIDPVGLVGDVVAAAKLRGGAVELTAEPDTPTVDADPSAAPAGSRQPHRQRPPPWGRATGLGCHPRRYEAQDRDLRSRSGYSARRAGTDLRTSCSPRHCVVRRLGPRACDRSRDRRGTRRLAESDVVVRHRARRSRSRCLCATSSPRREPRGSTSAGARRSRRVPRLRTSPGNPALAMFAVVLMRTGTRPTTG